MARSRAMESAAARRASPRRRCVPPGQVRIGQRLPAGLAAPVAYSRIPANVRTQYGLSPYSSYYYGDGRLYLVNPRTMQVVQMLNARMR